MVDLTPLNTLRLPAKAKRLIEINSLSDIKKLPSEPVLFLGEGANILFKSNSLDTIALVKLRHRSKSQETQYTVTVKVGAGENWHDFVTWTVENGWSGIEDMALIPGTVGAAPIGNIGAYGQSVDQTLINVRFLNFDTDTIEQFSNSECKLVYRSSIFKTELKNKFLLLSANFKLSKVPKSKIDYYSRHESLKTEIAKIAKPPYTIRDVYQAVINIRTQKMPDWTRIGTAGSFFKNPFVTKAELKDVQNKIPDIQYYPTTGMDYPQLTDPKLKASDYVKIPAGRLLDELGWRNKRIGNVATFDKHALVVITYPGATGQEVWEFAENMRADVKKNFNLDLEYEVVII